MTLKFEHGAFRLTGGLGLNKKLHALGFPYAGGKSWRAQNREVAVELLREFPHVQTDQATLEKLKERQ
jgi:hypothetical protein